MAHGPEFFLRHRSALPAMVAALLGLAACVSEMPDPAPISEIGVIEGRVFEAGEPMPAFIKFRSALNELDISAVVSADSLGWYRAELPVGVYRASVSLSRNANYSDNLDTVSVGRAVRRKDFPRGRARVTVALPSELAGTETSLRLQNGNFRADVRADVIDSLAVFDFRLLPPIAFTMRLTTGNDRSDVLLPGTYDAEQADSLRVGTGDVAHYADMRPMHILISGHVMGSWTLGSAEMWVAAVMPFGAIRSDVMCEPDGSFRIHLFAPERIRFRSRCNNVDQWFGGNRFHTATPYDLQAGDHLTDLLLVEGGLRIRTERADQGFDRSAEVQLVDADGLTRSFWIPNRQPYLISNLAAGSYRLKVAGSCTGDPWLSQWYQGAATEAEATPLEVIPGSFTDASIALQTGGVLTGILVEADGDAGQVGIIYVHSQDGTAICGSYGFESAGRFNVAGLPDGDYFLRTLNLGQDWWYPGTSDFALATRLTVADADTVSGLVWTVPETEEVVVFP